MKKLYGFIIFFLCVHKYASLESTKNAIAEVGKKITLPCKVESQGEMVWSRNGSPVLKYKQKQWLRVMSIKDVNRIRIPNLSTSDLEVNNVNLMDSGTYTCQKDKVTIYTVNLYVFEVSPTPSTNLIASEDLMLKLTLSSEQAPGLQISWKKDNTHTESGTIVHLKNVAIQHSGQYCFNISMENADEVMTCTTISVYGFFGDSFGIVYIKDPKSVTLPWTFNFEVRSKSSQSKVKVVEGNISYLSQVVKQLSIKDGSVCWPDDCAPDATVMKSLHSHLPKPKTGDYQMEITLEIEGRHTKLQRNVCVANLMVSSSDNDLSMESSVTLLCQTICLDKNGILCWQSMNVKHKKCGSPGQTNFTHVVTVLPETLGQWTCNVIVGPKTIISANVTIEAQIGFLDLSSYLFWVAIGVGVLMVLLIVMIIVILVARSRRLRRAQKRAWLLQHLNQQRRCEC